MLLGVQNLSASYGGIKALRNVSLNIDAGEVVAVLGSNGAGKTTLLKCISSIMKKTEGNILFEGKEIPGLTSETVKMGIVHVPEGRQIFTDLTVCDNLMAGAYLLSNNKEVDENLEKVYKLFPILKERANQYGGHLSGGEQQMLAIGRALMISPKLLMLDEPSLGLAPIIVTQIFDTIKRLKEQGTSILLVEQNAHKALSVSDRAYIISVGEVVMEGRSQELLKDKSLSVAYLG